jgi:hypothetical protein
VLGADSEALNYLVQNKVLNVMYPCPKNISLYDVRQSIMWIAGDEFEYKRENSVVSPEFMEISKLCSKLVAKHLFFINVEESSILKWDRNSEHAYAAEMKEVKLLVMSAYKSNSVLKHAFELAQKEQIKIYVSYFGYADNPDVNYAIYADRKFARPDEPCSQIEVEKAICCAVWE